MSSKLVSIIVVNLNREAFLKECLASVQAQDCRNWELIVVDNGSTDGSRAFLREYPHPIKTVFLERNTGFTGGNIAGLRQADGDFIALVNNDAVLAPDWVSQHMAAMEANPRAGTTASKIISYRDRERLDCAGDGMTTSARGYKLGEGHAPASRDEPRWVFGASAAAVLYRRRMLDEVGFLDPQFYFNCEDTDLGFRAQLMGWPCLYVPGAVAHHHINASVDLLGGKAVYYWSRNVELVVLKNMPFNLMLRYFHHRLVHEGAALAKNLSRPGYIYHLLLGKLAVLPLLPHALRERRRIQGARRISSRQLAAALTPLFSGEFLARKGAA